MDNSKSVTLRKSQWDQIKRHLNAANIERNEMMKQEEYIQSLNDMSEKMKKQWEKSKEEFQRKLEEKKAAERIEFRKHIQFYKELMEKQKNQKEQILAERRDTFFKQKDEPRALESALLCSEMLKEQEKQREFNKEIKAREKQSDMEYAKEIKSEYEKWLENQIIKKCKKLNKEQNEYLLVKAQADENIKSRQKQKNDQLCEEIKEIKIVVDELKEDEKRDYEKKNTLKNKLKLQREEALIKMRKSLEDEKNRNKIEDKLIEIYNETKSKLQKECEEKQKQIYNERDKFRSIVLKTFPDNSDMIKLKEEEAYKKAQADFKKKEIDQMKREKQRKNMLKEQSIQAYKEYLQQKEEEKAHELEQKKYEYENRLEHEKNTKAFNTLMYEKECEKISNNRKLIIEQLKMKENLKKKEQEERIKFFSTDKLKAMEAADKQFIEYAEQLLDECKKTGKTTLPLLKVINNYKSRYLPPEKYTPTHLKTHAPPAVSTMK